MSWRFDVNKNPHEAPFATEKPTVELCADELRKGVRCILRRHHAGDHEYHSPEAAAGITWKPRAS